MLALLILHATPALGAQPYTHGWATVGDMMAMHGKYNKMQRPLDADILFVAEHYSMITTGTGCAPKPAMTIEESVLETAGRIKAAKPTVPVGMYWRTDFALELAACSGFAEAWKSHPEYRLKDDAGGVVGKPGHFYMDFLNPNASAFFANVLLNVTTATLPSGRPVLDYIYCDGAGAWRPSNPRPYAPGVGLPRSKKLLEAKHAMFASVQQRMDARGLGQRLILNGMDLVSSAEQFVATGVAGAMFDHWTILQFLNRQTGQFNATMVDEAFQLVGSKLVSNFTTQIKGWVGPVVKQRGQYPPNYTPVKTPAGQAKAAAERFNSELAFFLLVATEHDYWIYSWFWSWYDYVGGTAASTIPANFFPQAQCALGAPTAPMRRIPGTWTYRREFAHASVFVDLTNRTNSRVDFAGCTHPTPPLPPGPRPGPSPPPPPSHHSNCPSASGLGCAECIAIVDQRCHDGKGPWCHQPCVHLSKAVGTGHEDCQPASWWEQHGAGLPGVSCTGNATGCSHSCAH